MAFVGSYLLSQAETTTKPFTHDMFLLMFPTFPKTGAHVCTHLRTLWYYITIWYCHAGSCWYVISAHVLHNPFCGYQTLLLEVQVRHAEAASWEQPRTVWKLRNTWKHEVNIIQTIRDTLVIRHFVWDWNALWIFYVHIYGKWSPL